MRISAGGRRVRRLSPTKIPRGALVGFRENRDKTSGSSTKFAHRTREPADERAQMPVDAGGTVDKNHEHVPDIQAARRS